MCGLHAKENEGCKPQQHKNAYTDKQPTFDNVGARHGGMQYRFDTVFGLGILREW
jgi:hypothetical protein